MAAPTALVGQNQCQIEIGVVLEVKWTLHCVTLVSLFTTSMECRLISIFPSAVRYLHTCNTEEEQQHKGQKFLKCCLIVFTIQRIEDRALCTLTLKNAQS